jgi:tetratricopeptide (TPR) repeat protein
MRKIVFLVTMLAVALSGFAQKKNVTRAESKLYEELTESNLKSAQADIEAAMKDPSTSNSAKTFFVAGQIYYKFYEEEEKKRLSGKTANQAIKDEYLVKAIDAFAKAALLDEQPDEKGKVNPKYTKELKRNLETYHKYLINEGYNNYQLDNFEKAVELWAKFVEVPSYPIMKSSGLEKDTVYNEMKFYSVDAANRVPKLKPVAIRYMEELKNAGYKEQNMYQWLYDEYKIAEDTVKFLKTLQDGLKRFPTDMYLMGNLINYYIYTNKLDEAVVYLDNAIKSAPQSAQYYAVKGNLMLNKKDYDNAIALFTKAAELEPDNVTAQAGLGLVYVTRADEMNDKASSIKDNKKYEEERVRAKAEFEKSIPYLEKARQLNPSDVDNLRVLRAVYLRLSRDEYNKIDAEVKALGY